MPVFKYRDPNSGEWINVAGGGGGAGESVDAYTKEETLSDETKTTFGLGADAVPNDAFSTIKSLIDAAVSTANSKAKIATGSYTGTGKAGSSNKNKLTFDFEPKFVIILGAKYFSNMPAHHFGLGILVPGLTAGFCAYGYAYTDTTNSTYNVPGVITTWSGNSVSWYAYASEEYQLNKSGCTYKYIAIG